MRDIWCQDEVIMICSTTKDDIDVVLEIEHDKENKHFVYRWSKEQHINKIEAEDWLHLVIIHKESNRIIGYILLDGLKNEHPSIELTRITIKDKGQGYGRKALKLITKLCFEIIGCHRLWLDVFDDNKYAIHLYKSEGFIYEGTLRECKQYGDNYYSMHILSMLKHEYLNKNKEGEQ